MALLEIRVKLLMKIVNLELILRVENYILKQFIRMEKENMLNIMKMRK